MKTQLHKRLLLELVSAVLKAFNERRLSEDKACPLMGISSEPGCTVSASAGWNV
jgi:hypothetical protein